MSGDEDPARDEQSEPDRCPECQGAGTRQIHSETGAGRTVTCGDCRGTGVAQ